MASYLGRRKFLVNEWDNLEAPQAFYNSKVWKDLAPQRDKAQKLTRLYAVEAQVSSVGGRLVISATRQAASPGPSSHHQAGRGAFKLSAR
jgi:hypothetical protein